MKKSKSMYGLLGASIILLGILFFVVIVSLLLYMGEDKNEIDIDEDALTSRYINVNFPVTKATDEEIPVIDDRIEESKQGVLEVEESRKVLQVDKELTPEQLEELEEKYDIQFTDDTQENGVYVVTVTDETDIDSLEDELDTTVETDIPVKIAADTVDWGITRIGADQVWEQGSGTGVIVGVIDTGVQKDHPDLINNLTTGYDFVNNDTDATDDHGHGTHVAGITSATLNQAGVVGASHSSTIMPIKVLNNSG
jgi:subtilisin family serine protease